MGPLDANVILRNLPYLWDGLQLSLLLAALAIGGGIFFGAIMGVLRMSSIRPVAWLALGYVNFFRSVPLILVIFWIYFLVPLLLGRATGPFLSAWIAIILFQDTSLVYVVTLRDFMTSIATVANQDLRLVELYLFAAAVYFAICFAGSRFINRLGGGFRR